MTINLSLEQRAHLATLYGEPQRRYHTLAHVHQLLREIETLKVDQKTKEILEVAAWFHDSIYDPLAPKGKNENDSHQLLMYSTLGNLTGKLAAGYCILATKDHIVPADTTPENQETVKLFLDLDLSILGQSEDDYLTYAVQVGQEYILAGLPEEKYIAGRMVFLQKKLSAHAPRHIYHTQEFRNRYEAAARFNIQDELNRLQAMLDRKKTPAPESKL